MTAGAGASVCKTLASGWAALAKYWAVAAVTRGVTSSGKAKTRPCPQPCAKRAALDAVGAAPHP